MSTNPEILSMKSKEHEFDNEISKEKSAVAREQSEVHHTEEKLKDERAKLLDAEIKLHQAEEGKKQMHSAIDMKERADKAADELKRHQK